MPEMWLERVGLIRLKRIEAAISLDMTPNKPN
jgi:hypothetical protein